MEIAVRGVKLPSAIADLKSIGRRLLSISITNCSYCKHLEQRNNFLLHFLFAKTKLTQHMAQTLTHTHTHTDELNVRPFVSHTRTNLTPDTRAYIDNALSKLRERAKRGSASVTHSLTLRLPAWYAGQRNTSKRKEHNKTANMKIILQN